MKQSKFGFTLVELLIVIALLGALSVGLLAALDPFEQLKKGTDTGIRNTTSELQGAAIRYYAIKGFMPWCSEANPNCATDDPTSADLTSTIIISAVSNMAAAGELKSNFMELASAYKSRIFITGNSSADEPGIKVCFLPQAKSFKADPNTKYFKNGQPNPNYLTDCKGHAANATGECYWCIM